MTQPQAGGQTAADETAGFPLTHSQLCLLTAQKYVQKARLALWEYQSYASGEFPDVLVYHAYDTTIYEIKMSRADFLADAQKQARVKWRSPVYWHLQQETSYIEDRIFEGTLRPVKRSVFQLEKIKLIPNHPKTPEKHLVQAPHLGSRRYFVCPAGLIAPAELPEGWGLIWFSAGRFLQKRPSGSFRADVRTERNLVAHAMQRLAGGNSTGILVRTFEEKETQ